MGKRFWSLALTAALVAGVFVVGPARAAVTVPAEPNIADPAGDANYLNEGFIGAGQGNNNVTGDDASSVGDILAVWFSNTADTISWHVQTEAVQPSSGAAYWTEIGSNPDAAGTNCISWDIVVAAPTYQSDSFARVRDECTPGESIPAELTVEELADGTGVVTGTVGISALPPQAAGKLITQPVAAIRHATGPLPDDVPELGGNTFIVPTLDDTDVGTDYTITTGPTVAPEPAPTVEPPGKGDPPGKGKKNGCKKGKGKGKKKGACPGKKPPKPPAPPAASACPAYVPGEEGAEAPTTILTDAATADAPVVVELETEPGMASDQGVGEFATGSPIYDGAAHLFQNVQVDTDSADAGLYVRLDFVEGQDYDLYLNYPTGDEADHSGDFNPVANTAFICGEGSCESSMTSEAVLGIRTADCGGWTVDVVSYLTEGGPATLSLWLGESVADPTPPPEETAMEMFYRALGL